MKQIYPFWANANFRAQHLGANTLIKRDFMRQLIERDIDHFNLLNTGQPDLHILVGDIQGASEVCDARGTFIGWTRYTFGKWMSDPDPLDIHLDKETYKILVHDETRWMKLSEWLHQQADCEVSVWTDSEQEVASRRAELTQKQWRHWVWITKTKNKTFNFLDLPSELRLKIYHLTFGGSQVSPSSKPAASRHVLLGIQHGWGDEGLIFQRPDIRPLLLNNQVYNEASHELFRSTVFRVTHIEHLDKLVRNNDLAKRISHLELALPHEEYLDVFKAQYLDLNVPRRHRTDVGDADPDAIAKMIHSMDLDHLTIELDKPRVNMDRSTIYRESVLCQREVVDMIFKSMLPWIAGNEVSITGYAKTRQKNAFETKCAKLRKACLNWFKMAPPGYEDLPKVSGLAQWNAEPTGGVQLYSKEFLDLAGEFPCHAREEVLDAEATSIYGSDWEYLNGRLPECGCPVSCHPETWTADD